MEPEQENGNIEYKIKLIGKSAERIERIASQMRFRCEEGGSECIYNIGVEDDGTIVGITPQEYDESLRVLNSAADKNNYISILLTTTSTGENLAVYEVLIRELNEDKYLDIKVAVAGSVDSGKSSFLGVMTTGRLDNGRGSSRISVFNYPHEVKTGRTSSIGHHIMGFDINGKTINYESDTGKLSWPEIVKRSTKIISMFDLCGHKKYLKTTILGLASSYPDLCLIMVGGNKGIKTEKVSSERGKKKSYDNMTKEHIFLCITLKIPFAIIVTKIDMMIERQNVLKDTMDDIQNIIKCPGVRRQPIRVETDDDVIICAKQIHTESIVPIFMVSNVTGSGVEHVKMFLNVLGKTTPRRDDINDVEFHIDNTWTVPGVGTVIGGHLSTGKIYVNDKLWIGPNNGKYEQVIVKSIHCKRVMLQNVEHGSYVCLGLKKYERNRIRRGNVIVSKKSQHVLCTEFTADIKVMRSHSTTIRIGYQPIIHASAIRQSATLIDIVNKVNSRNPKRTRDDKILRTGDSATATFKMICQAEFIVPGMRILLCEGLTKIIGIVKSVN